VSNDWSKLEILPPNDPSSIVWSSRGGDGSGKSYFALTAPGPIFVCAFDQNGLDRVDKTIRAEREIRIGRYGFNPVVYNGDREKIRKAASPIWDRFVDEYRTALYHMKQQGRGTVIWDREDMSWGLRRYAAFGGQKNEGSRTGALDYGDLNEEYIGLIQEARDCHVNLGLLQGLTDKWVAKFDNTKGKMQNYNTGELVPDGFKKLPDHVDITLDHRWDKPKKAYVTTIRKFPVKDEKDKDVENLDFFTMACLAFPDSDPMQWLNEVV
jgi:hypothetical protein